MATSRRPPKKPSNPPARKTSSGPAGRRSSSRAPGSRTSSRPTNRRATSKQSALVRRLRNLDVPEWLHRVVAVAAFGAAFGLVTLGGVLWYFSRDLPAADTLRNYAPPQTTRVLDRHGDVVGELFQERRTVVPMSRIPRVLVLSVLAAEDADFYHHAGMDVPGIMRILVKTITSGRASQGASTITQQVVKNLLLSPERTVQRKIRELILARRLERELSKDEILHLYLNHINFGHGRYGVQEASKFYFDKDVDELDLAEASLIAGIPQAPARLSPRSHPDAARRRQAFVLNQLERKRELYWSDLPLQEIERAREKLPKLSERDPDNEGAPEVITLARRALVNAVGEERAQRGGFTVKTGLDLRLQKQARLALRRGLRAVDKRQRLVAPIDRRRVSDKRLAKLKRKAQKGRTALKVGGTYDAVISGADDAEGAVKLIIKDRQAVANVSDHARYNPKGLKASKLVRAGSRVRAIVDRVPGEGPIEARMDLGPQGAVVLIDPRSRQVRALVGGYRADAGFNRALQARRQPGSTFKPIVYAVGIQSRKLTPATTILDAPGVFDKYRPGNYETWAHKGAVRLRLGLAKSINLVAIRVIDEVGPPSVVDMARAMGIESPLEPSLPLALGASVVHPLELTNAYATLAAGGRYESPQIITEILDPEGEPIKLPARAPARDVLTRAEAYVVTSMLTSVVKEGTAARAQRLKRPAAGKTGTSNNARDAWFVGYTPEWVAGVWVGYDDNRPLGTKESGSKTALPIWVELMGAASKGRPVTEFAVPGGVVTAEIDPATGLLAYEGMEGALTEVFLDGTVPTEQARPPDVADPTTFMMEQLGGFEAPPPVPAEAPPDAPM